MEELIALQVLFEFSRMNEVRCKSIYVREWHIQGGVLANMETYRT